ncbi:hypothetical protein BH11BAC7_BH11BAC7_31480 [soil metagenome]
MKQLFLLLVFLLASVYLNAQKPVPSPKKNGQYELKKNKLVVEKGNCKNGFKTGTWEYFSIEETPYPKSKKIKEEIFDDKGFLIRTTTFKCEDGKLEERTKSSGVIAEGYKLYFEVAHTLVMEGFYVNELKDSVWTYYRRFENKQDTWKKERWESGFIRERNMYYANGVIFKHELFFANDSVLSFNYFNVNGAEITGNRSLLARDSIPGIQLLKNDSPAARDFVEVVPEFPGLAGFSSFVTQNVHYPSSASQNYMGGRIIIEFTLNWYGEVQDIEIKNPTPSRKPLENEAIRVIEISPPWTPGSLNGITQRVHMSLPVNFKMN